LSFEYLSTLNKLFSLYSTQWYGEDLQFPTRVSPSYKSEVTRFKWWRTRTSI